ncbi:hypothetical protein R3P38DRAFT_3348705 [Favolaschia claudopus]|uniref:Uncharacterized protein n=1 Tax=Favolaschia claudopus TaxID=2862362 RepID=A0AAW0CST5_9AGAR
MNDLQPSSVIDVDDADVNVDIDSCPDAIKPRIIRTDGSPWGSLEQTLKACFMLGSLASRPHRRRLDTSSSLLAYETGQSHDSRQNLCPCATRRSDSLGMNFVFGQRLEILKYHWYSTNTLIRTSHPPRNHFTCGIAYRSSPARCPSALIASTVIYWSPSGTVLTRSRRRLSLSNTKISACWKGHDTSLVINETKGVCRSLDRYPSPLRNPRALTLHLLTHARVSNSMPPLHLQMFCIFQRAQVSLLPAALAPRAICASSGRDPRYTAPFPTTRHVLLCTPNALRPRTPRPSLPPYRMDPSGGWVGDEGRERDWGYVVGGEKKESDGQVDLKEGSERLTGRLYRPSYPLAPSAPSLPRVPLVLVESGGFQREVRGGGEERDQVDLKDGSPLISVSVVVESARLSFISIHACGDTTAHPRRSPSSLPQRWSFTGSLYIVNCLLPTSPNLSAITISNVVKKTQDVLALIEAASAAGSAAPIEHIELGFEDWDDEVLLGIIHRLPSCRQIKLFFYYSQPSDDFLFNLGIQHLPSVPHLHTLHVHAAPIPPPPPMHYRRRRHYFSLATHPETQETRIPAVDPEEEKCEEYLAVWKKYNPALRVVKFVKGREWRREGEGGRWFVWSLEDFAVREGDGVEEEAEEWGEDEGGSLGWEFEVDEEADTEELWMSDYQ